MVVVAKSDKSNSTLNPSLSVSHAEMPTKYQDLVGVTFICMGWLFNIHYQC